MEMTHVNAWFNLTRGGRGALLIVSPPGIHISLGICVWGYTYHGDTHITVTPEQWITRVKQGARKIQNGAR